MNKIYVIILILFSFVVQSIAVNSNAGTVSSAFLEISPGARAAGLGESFTGIADDFNALYWNPAGICQLSKMEIGLVYNLWLENTAYNYVGFIYPLPLSKFSFGLSVSYLDYGNIEGRDNSDNLLNSFSANSFAGTVSLGYKISQQLMCGLNIKSIQEKIESASASTMAGDISALYIGEKWNIGFMIQNIGPGLQFVKESYPLPLTVRLGNAYKVSNKLLVSWDISSAQDTGIGTGIGLEYQLNSMFVARTGYGYNSGKISDSGLTGITLGVGFKISKTSIDYAFVPYGDLLGNTHRISLGMKF